MTTDPRGLSLHGIPHAVAPGEAAWEFLSEFRWHTRQTASLVGVVRDLQLLQDTIEDVRIEVVRDMRTEGMSWTEVGEALGVTRQAARQRFGGHGIR